ncbi:MAG TPA: hypothetical protein PLM56_09550 [Cyclobacteriaceae bacterium]|jgi:hypothetical protein|nr:hypothetical protein [Cytophagales bacterium]HRE65890.1 hypothetical protein [Cyclobacteriaceae bacterium]HRF33734.1 hypothetical protein [Cyclobacteriaceae bacterium]
MSKRNLLVLIGLLCCAACLAQEINIKNDTLIWEVVEVKDKAFSERISTPSEVIVYPGGEIVWTQPQVERVYKFLVEDVSGSWSHVGEDGFVEYRVKINESQGLIIFKRENGILSIDFNMKRGEKTTFPFTLFVGSIQPK